MRRPLLAFALALLCRGEIMAQAPLRVSGFGFGAGVVTQMRAEPAAQISASLLLTTSFSPVEIRVGSSVADLKDGQGTQRDAFLSATAFFPFSRYLIFGGGAELHALDARVAGGRNDTALLDLEHSLSGLRPALAGRAGVRLPLAAANAAALEVGGRASVMRNATQLAAILGVMLSPSRGRLRAGEGVPPARAPSDFARSWDAVVDELMLLDDHLEPLNDVLATRNTLLMKFDASDHTQLNDAVARVARILNGSEDKIFLTINAPEPISIATAATSGGFPAERISTVTTDKGVTILATRLAPATSIRSAR